MPPDPAAGKGPSGTLTISNEQGTQWNCSFNPFNPGNLGEGVTMGQVYEPLAFVEHAENAKATPWLASELGLEQRQQDADLHHQEGRQVQRRHAR